MSSPTTSSDTASTSNTGPASSATPAPPVASEPSPGEVQAAVSQPSTAQVATTAVVPKPSAPTGPIAAPAGRPTVRSGMGHNIKLGAPNTAPRIIEGNAPLVPGSNGGQVMHPSLAFRSKLNNNFHGPISGPRATATPGPPPDTPSGPSGSRASTSTTAQPPPAHKMRADRNTRVNDKKKDVIISSTGILRNQGRYVDEMVKGKQKYVLATAYHLPTYDMAEYVKSLTETERKSYWAKAHVEIEINVDSPTMNTDILAIVKHINRLGPGLQDHLANLFINLRIPPHPLLSPPPKISTLPSITALTPLAKKLAMFKGTQFVIVTLHTLSVQTSRCEWQWLDHAVPFCELSYHWNLDWWPDTYVKAIRYRADHEEYRYVDEGWGRLCWERDEAASSVAREGEADK